LIKQSHYDDDGYVIDETNTVVPIEGIISPLSWRRPPGDRLSVGVQTNQSRARSTSRGRCALRASRWSSGAST
jgi:hypothetical protein